MMSKGREVRIISAHNGYVVELERKDEFVMDWQQFERYVDLDLRDALSRTATFLRIRGPNLIVVLQEED